MATIKSYLRSSKDNANVYFRLSDGRKIIIYHKSNIKVDPKNWNSTDQCIKATSWRDRPEDKRKFDKSITDRKEIVLTAYCNIKEGATSQLLEAEIDKLLHPEKYVQVNDTPETLFTHFDKFLLKHKLSEGRRNHFKVVKRALQRFELYTAIITGKPFTLTFETITPDILSNIETFLKDEITIRKEKPELYITIPEKRKQLPRGQNTLNGIMTKIRTFIIWANDNDITNNNPFKKFPINESIYGTPYFITIDERNKLYNFDLSERPQLAIQRDIFVFQCLIGCRIGDLYKLTAINIKDDNFIEYIARKTKLDEPVTVRVPLNKTAIEILSKYPENKNGQLLPYIAEQNYNYAIKDMFKLAGLTRMITVIDPATGEPEQRPLNEICSSHLSRRCFIGNLYDKTQDPNLIGEMSGHVPGSLAFNRYKRSNDTILTKLINLLD
jgi:integrase